MDLIGLIQLIKVPATIVHVFSVVFGMGAALVSDVLFSFYGKDKKLNWTEIKTLSILKDIVFYSLILISTSGIIIYLSDIERYLDSDKFLAKMSILLVLLLNGLVLNRYIWTRLLKRDFFTSQKERIVRKLSFICGSISVVSWLSVCALGVLDRLPIDYCTIIAIYTIVTIFGMIVSVIVEKRELN